MLRTVSSLVLVSLVSFSGPVAAQSTAATSGATQTTRYGAQIPLQSVSKLSDPQRELGATSVRDSSGERIGQVQSVQTNTKGSARSVQIALNTSPGAAKLVSVPARDLRYDFAGNAVVADLSKSQIAAMPAQAGQLAPSLDGNARSR